MVKFTAGRFFHFFCTGDYFMSWISHFLLLVSLLCVAIRFFCKLLLYHAACIFSAQVRAWNSFVETPNNIMEDTMP